MDFYGSESTILTEVKPRSLLLPKIHKTHIARHRRSVFALYMVQAHWSMDARLLTYYHSLLYSVGYGTTVVKSYCDIRHHCSSTRVTFLSNNSTIWCHSSTIWHHNSITMITDNIGKYWLVNVVFWVSMHHYCRWCEQESTNQHWVFTFDI